MSLFAHYPAKPSAVIATSTSLMTAARRLNSVRSSVVGRTSVAAAQADGALRTPIASVDRTMGSDAARLTASSVVAGAALNGFAGAITTYNGGVDGLNRTYESAKAAGFHAAPVPAGATGPDGDPLSPEQRQAQYERRVTDAGSELERSLRAREAALMRGLDIAAERTATLLRADPESVVFRNALATATTPARYQNVGARAGGPYGKDTGTEKPLLDRVLTLGSYLWESNLRRAANPFQTLWDATTGTTFMEEATAWSAIMLDGGALHDGGNQAGEATYIYGANPGPDGETVGHTVILGDGADADGNPEDYGNPPGSSASKIAHELQHVYDTEDLGAVGYYGIQAHEMLTGEDEPSTETRAREVEEDAKDPFKDPIREPEGVGGPIDTLTDLVDGTLHKVVEGALDRVAPE